MNIESISSTVSMQNNFDRYSKRCYQGQVPKKEIIPISNQHKIGEIIVPKRPTMLMDHVENANRIFMPPSSTFGLNHNSNVLEGTSKQIQPTETIEPIPQTADDIQPKMLMKYAENANRIFMPPLSTFGFNHNSNVLEGTSKQIQPTETIEPIPQTADDIQTKMLMKHSEKFCTPPSTTFEFNHNSKVLERTSMQIQPIPPIETFKSMPQVTDEIQSKMLMKHVEKFFMPPSSIFGFNHNSNVLEGTSKQIQPAETIEPIPQTADDIQTKMLMKHSEKFCTPPSTTFEFNHNSKVLERTSMQIQPIPPIETFKPMPQVTDEIQSKMLMKHVEKFFMPPSSIFGFNHNSKVLEGPSMQIQPTQPIETFKPMPQLTDEIQSKMLMKHAENSNRFFMPPSSTFGFNHNSKVLEGTSMQIQPTQPIETFKSIPQTTVDIQPKMLMKHSEKFCMPPSTTFEFNHNSNVLERTSKQIQPIPPIETFKPISQTADDIQPKTLMKHVENSNRFFMPSSTIFKFKHNSSKVLEGTSMQIQPTQPNETFKPMPQVTDEIQSKTLMKHVENSNRFFTPSSTIFKFKHNSSKVLEGTSMQIQPIETFKPIPQTTDDIQPKMLMKHVENSNRFFTPSSTIFKFKHNSPKVLEGNIIQIQPTEPIETFKPILQVTDEMYDNYNSKQSRVTVIQNASNNNYEWIKYNSNNVHYNPGFEAMNYNYNFGKSKLSTHENETHDEIHESTNTIPVKIQRLNDASLQAYRMCSSTNMPSTQYAHIGSNILKPGIPKLSAHEVGDDVSSSCPVIYPTKQMSSQIMKNDSLIKTIGMIPSRSILTSQSQSRIVKPSLKCSIIESQNVSPLIITPKPLVNHNSNDTVPAKIIPISSSHVTSHFSVINKTGSYDNNIPEYTGIRQSLVSGAPPVYTQSDFACFPPKSYYHKNTIVNPAVIHGPISGNNEESCLNIPNSQHVFKPIISPRPSILRKRDADGVLRAQKNLIPILTKPDLEDNHSVDEISLNRNGFSDTGLQIESIMVPQMSDIILPQISALTRQSHIMVEISPRKKPRKQLLPVNQDSPFKIVCDELEYVDEKMMKNDKIKDFLEDPVNCNDDNVDADEEDEVDDLDDNMDADDDFLADDDYDGNDEDDEFGFDFAKSNKTFYEEAKTSSDINDTSSCTQPKNKRPTLLGNLKVWRARSHHFQKYTDFKIKETKKQLAEIQQNKKWVSDSRSGWRVQHLLRQFDGMVKTEDDVIIKMTELMHVLETNVFDNEIRYGLVELVKDNLQRSKVTKKQLEEINLQLTKIFEYKPLIDEVVEKYCPKELKKKCIKNMLIKS